ncbi:uncharacterized protein LOC107774680 [Nicotiana tabacum]|uniref:MULE transposase domain-containing protein n=1 Tax=Nicotiana tabacum TaxID=4097 RepID=A0A1S3YCR0_TOBAC|nr:PREDICTED: uncharacterized protein LOC107774680 [Nicotiana tabacum]XP_016449788.1 PREDICTED: uncharacterized protein LOC107774680 [Nicotiana tabacum]
MVVLLMSINKIEAYANELRISNPGSDVIINTSKDALAEGNRRFSWMYIYFHALKVGFKSGLRPFVGLDGTFLKGKVKGQLLVVVTLDSLKYFYPIAWAIVEKKSYLELITWNWFLTLLKHSLDLKLEEGFTFISDMQKSVKEKQPKGGGKTKKRPRSLIDEDSDGSMTRSTPSARLTIEEELHLTTPQPSQLS